MGWSTTSTGSVEYTDSQSVTNLTTTDNGIVTLYAVWQVKSYTIGYMLNGGINNSSNPSSYNVESETITLQSPTKTGYTFTGWTENGNSITKIEKGTTGSKTLVANWQIKTYTIKFNANGGTGTMSDLAMTYGTAKNLTANSFTRLGYTFMGWATTSDGAKAYNDGATVNNLTATDGGTVTLYAVWTANTYTVKFNANGGTGTMSDLAMTYGTAKNLTENTFERTGYTFICWATTSDGAKAYNDGATVNNLTATNGGTVTLYAVWQIEIYTINYVLNGGNNSDINPSSYTVNDEFTLLQPIRSGYTFTGWTENNATITKITKGTVGNKTIIANWSCDVKLTLNSDNTYTVTGLNNNVSDLVILSEYEGIQVTSIGENAFYYCTSLTSIEIPNSVTSIGYGAFSSCTSLESITLPFVGATLNGTENVHFGYIFGTSVPSSLKTVVITGGTSIGEWAFYNCSNLTSVEIGSGVTSIGGSAFSGCTALTSIVIGSGVTSIGDGAFLYCTSLKSIEVDKNNQNYKSIEGNLYSKDGKTLIRYAIGKKDASFTIPEEVISIGEYAFYHCSNLTSIEIPEEVTSIGYCAFGWCESLGSIEIPNSVTSIGDSAFYYCTSLESIEIPNSVTSIGGEAFFYCTSLTSIEVGSGVTSIGDFAFDGCTSLTSIEIPNSVTSIGDYAFSHSALTSIVIPNSVTSIGSGAFNWCESLTSIEIPNSVTSIGVGTFYNCSNLTSIVIPNSVTSIGDLAFDSCTSLTSIEIPNSVTSIEGSAFSNCTALTSIEIPNSVTSIGNYAFYGCTALTSIVIPKSVTSIGIYAFMGCTSLTSLEIPNSVTSIGEYAFYNCTSLKSIEVDKNNQNYKSIEGNLYSKDGKTLIQYAIGKTATTFTIPNSVTSIGSYAFYGCTALTSIEIPNSVTSIGSFAFYNCTALTSIEIPNSVTSIGYYAFYNCTSLESITLPFVGATLNGTKNVHFGYIFGTSSYQNNASNVPSSLKTVVITGGTSIGEWAFHNCSNLTSIVIPNSVTTIGSNAFYYCTALTSITIPNSVTSIGDYAFSGCALLTSIEIGSGVTSIGYGAFSSCISLESIVIPNSVTSIGNYAFRFCDLLTSIEIGSGVTSIGSGAFYGCTSLNSVTFANPNGWSAGTTLIPSATLEDPLSAASYLKSSADNTKTMTRSDS